MQTVIDTPLGLTPEVQAFYRRSLRILGEAGVPFLVGGAYALERYTGVVRHTKDIDLFVRPDDCRRALEAYAAAGYHTDLTFDHWLGKAFEGDEFIDIIFSSGNAVATVDDEWFEYSVQATVFAEPVLLCPVEEMIWSKAFIAERERYDGADVNHLLLARGADLDWTRLLRRFGSYWRVLFSHLVLFGFTYPSERDRIPAWVMHDLLERLQHELRAPNQPERICQGTLLSRAQYLVDVDYRGFRDARLLPRGAMSRQEIDQWTAGIAMDGPR